MAEKIAGHFDIKQDIRWPDKKKLFSYFAWYPDRYQESDKSGKIFFFFILVFISYFSLPGTWMAGWGNRIHSLSYSTAVVVVVVVVVGYSELPWQYCSREQCSLLLHQCRPVAAMRSGWLWFWCWTRFYSGARAFYLDLDYRRNWLISRPLKTVVQLSDSQRQTQKETNGEKEKYSKT